MAIIQGLYDHWGYFLSLWSTIVTKVKLKLWKVPYGKHLKVRGGLIVYKSNGTSITIGDDVVFNSSSRYNFRGINHKSILQTGEGGNIVIGNRCGFSGVSIVSSASVTIGDDVLCGTNVMIGDRNDHEDRFPQFPPEPIVIEDNVWVGMNTVIMKGVHIGKNSIIGANSVVTKDIPEGVIAAGNPCKVIRSV